MSTDLTAALTRLPKRLHGAQARVADVTRVSSGASLETWSFDVVDAGGGTPEETIDVRHPYVLRRRAGAPALHSIGLDVEAALLQAAAQHGVLAPPLIHLCDGVDGLGEAHVTRRIAGETLGRKIVADARFDAVQSTLARQCGEQLARIHATAGTGRLPLETLDATAVLARYEQTYRGFGAHRPVLELAFQHLRTHAPPLERPVLLHGDFRNGNLVVDPERGIAAVLDWELAHRGDPAEDLGWLCVNSWRFGASSNPVGGFGAYADLLSGYTAAGGKEIPLNTVRYWQAVGSLKWAVMCLVMYDGWAAGTAASVERPIIGRRVSEAEIDLLNMFEAGL